ncbi:histidine-rich glycoprotein [Tribolium castaneum]|uniref:Pupal cuticle protein Edg-84A-like Protein n=1 Tax=Tribolium castaneum TaxID=7070 RepID=D6WMT2_TRICA|nr:PREDICTED: histidine-rich glycoprotein [Tribolium castaneum]EFA04512.1 hypothetical protein TcasGA2_TC016307 [Tribolium castaneum]|eukprot:XP_970278.2 PREDICTED: histidine-rich glycoprotein [Tribolium castaneum]
MARPALITIALAIIQTSSSEFAHPYTEAHFHKQPSVVYVPVCTPECLKSTHHQSHFTPNNYHQLETHQSHFTPIAAEQANYHHLEGHQAHHGDSGSASVYQQSDHHGSQHEHSIHHHGSGESHQVFKQEHQHLDEGHHYDHEHHHHHEKDKNINYKFEYSVNDHKTGDVKHQKEERKGDAVNGEYSLLEEDGNVRTVKYFADWKSGFHAQVHNSKPRAHG